ncbi:MAG: tRNA dihydrouridine synthase DusB [Gemmatimonas sp.]|nr:tRNA dihydrouridine synthase DusB [Gemmatimonas sp.]
MAIPLPMPVDPKFSRRFNILYRMLSDFSSSCNNPIISLRTSSLVALSRSSFTTSSEKNSLSSMIDCPPDKPDLKCGKGIRNVKIPSTSVKTQPTPGGDGKDDRRGWSRRETPWARERPSLEVLSTRARGPRSEETSCRDCVPVLVHVPGAMTGTCTATRSARTQGRIMTPFTVLTPLAAWFLARWGPRSEESYAGEALPPRHPRARLCVEGIGEVGYFVAMKPNFLDLLESDRVPLYLAPQAGVSESPFRRLCRSYGADVVVSEFVSSEGIRRNDPRTHEYLRFDDDERPIGIQIFGAEPAAMAEAAALVEDVYGPDFLDLNFGCPVKKVVKRNGGSGCLRDLDLVQQIIRSVAAATRIPTTVKIRSGWSEELRNPVEIALRCQDAGAAVLTLHARTRTQMYGGSADWDEIAAVVDALDIPVVGNGDVWNGADALRLREHTGCAGIMIARGSHGAPWIFGQARAALDGKPIPLDPFVRERFDMVREHAQLAIAFERDEEKAMIEFRKHLGWYTKGLPNGRQLRQELFGVRKLVEVDSLLERYAEESATALAA